MPTPLINVMKRITTKTPAEEQIYQSPATQPATQQAPQPQQQAGPDFGPVIKTLTTRKQYRDIDEKNKAIEYEWNTYYAPKYQENANLLQQMATDEANKAIAEAQARYGWMRSAGAGTAGMWETGQLDLTSKALQLRTNLAQLSQKYMNEAWQAFQTKKDEQSFQEHMLQLQAIYRERYLQQVAELNDASWWEKLGGVAGSILALVGGGLPTQYGVGDWFKGIGYRLS